MALKFGVWSPVCGGWLRVRGPVPKPSAKELVELARGADDLGYDYYYVPEHYVNAVYGPEHAVSDAWVVSAAAVSATKRLRVLTAVQPGFKWPGVVAKMGATLAEFRTDAFGLSLLAGWWQLEAESYGDVWLTHPERYARAAEFLDVVRGLWTRRSFSYQGRYYAVQAAELEPKPSAPPPVLIAGESDAAVELAARAADYLFINGDEPERVWRLASRVKALARERHGRRVRVALSAFAIVDDSDVAARARAQRLLANADRETIDYFKKQIDGAVVAHNRGDDEQLIEANLGLSAGLVGSAASVLERVRDFEAAGVDTVLVKFADTRQESARFAREVIATYASVAGAERRRDGLDTSGVLA